MALKPLATGGKAKTNTGTTVKRGDSDGELFHLNNDTGSLILEDVEIKWLAELAGFEVDDR